MTATRIFNYVHFLLRFDYVIEHRNTTEHRNVNYLSQYPTEQSPTNFMDYHSIIQICQLDILDVDSNMFVKEIANNKHLKPVLQALKNRQSGKTFGFYDTELSLQDGCILKG